MGEQGNKSLRHFAQDFRGAAYREELRGNWAAAVLFRPPAIVLAWQCARIGLAPVHVTFIAFLAALSLPALAWWLPLSVAPLALALAGALFQILDCTDGTLARRTGRTSQTGADLDFFVDMLQWALLYTALGLLADRTLETGAGFAALGAFAAWARLMARVIRDRLSDGADSEPAPIRALDLPSVFLGGISGLIPLLALSGSWIGVGVGALMLYSLLDIAEALATLVKRT